MNIVYENLDLPPSFPFDLYEQDLRPYYSMGAFMHFHDCFELSFARSGSCTYEIGERVYEMNPGDLMVINDVEPHRMHTGRKGMHQTVMVFSPSLILGSLCSSALDNDYIKAFSERKTGFSNKIPSSDPRAEGIKEAIQDICTEHAERKEGWQLMIKSRLLSLLTILYRYYLSSDTIQTSRKDLLKISPVLKVIESDPAADISTEDMAELIGITKQHFCTIFKKSTGQTLTSYINSVRIKKCTRLLLETDSCITDIAYSCGFNNLSHFNKVFLNSTGSTPSEFRKKGR